MKIPASALNPLQIAYIIGRTHYLPLGGVGMHDFRVFRGNLDSILLQESLTILVQKHAALRTLIDIDEFTQSTREKGTINFTEINFRDLSYENATLQANQFIDSHSHYLHDLADSPWHIWLILLPEHIGCDYNSILLTSFDALILDGYSISILLEELFDHYHNALCNSYQMESAVIETNKSQQSEFDFYKNKQEDVFFWQEKIRTMTNTLDFPWKRDLESIKTSKYARKTVFIKKQHWDVLRSIATQESLLPNALLNSIVLEALAEQSNSNHIYAAIPISFSLYQNQLSNHSTVIPIGYHKRDDKSFFESAHEIQRDTLDALEHVSFSGIEIARLICDQVKTSIPFPIVLTNGLSWRLPPHRDYIDYYSGQTQTPQVAMDIRLSFSHAKELVIDIDYAIEAIDLNVIDVLLTSIQDRICQFSLL
ncbi:condensation domain-containing protein [Brenneria sp. g21c3]|uniref:condensation domain-containing protein n=1 Tax=Brenneria sp. g21c3 TaxID=3093893 RepID=UPI002EBD3DA2|nr:condensation domain-containing protein [Brenneria sp. g21c3]